MTRKQGFMLFLTGLVVALAACGGGEAPVEDEPAEAAYASEATSGAGTPEASAVAQLNEMCPENWCMGDYRYEFQTVACGGASCTLRFTAEGRQGSVELDYDVPLVDEFGDLDPSYFERVTDALDEWERAQAG